MRCIDNISRLDTSAGRILLGSAFGRRRSASPCFPAPTFSPPPPSPRFTPFRTPSPAPAPMEMETTAVLAAIAAGYGCRGATTATNTAAAAAVRGEWWSTPSAAMTPPHGSLTYPTYGS